jgi:3-methyladenine DNA glycosylase AlkD
MLKAAEIIKKLKNEIRAADRPENRINYQQFFKERLKEPEGLKAVVLRSISNNGYKEIRGESLDQILRLCDQLLASDERYMRFVAFEWALKSKRHFRAGEFTRFERWLKTYVSSWGSCDHLCTGPIGVLIAQYQQLAVKVRPWRRSRNRWVRRGAAVSLIMPVRQRLLLDEVFRTADTLLEDQDDMVQKGYGWMLKEASNRFPDEVFAYVMKQKARMPRTALRYAIEKLPPTRRKQAMAK